MKLSVVIVNWNTGALLRKCILSVIIDQNDSGLAESEIIVVDNASSDRSGILLKSEFPGIRYIQNSRNLGFAVATNQGIHASDADYILLLNPDTEIRPGTLLSLLNFLQLHPEAGAVGPMLLNADGSLQISAYPEPRLVGEIWRLFHLDHLWSVGSYPVATWSRNAHREVDTLMGACILLRRKALDECGLLDERFFMYSEDQDLCRRLRTRNWRIFWLPRAEVIHYGGQSTRQVKSDMFVRLYREKIAYFRKHRGPGSVAIYKLILLGASLLRLMLNTFFGLAGGEKRRRASELNRLYGQLVRELPGL